MDKLEYFSTWSRFGVTRFSGIVIYPEEPRRFISGGKVFGAYVKNDEMVLLDRNGMTYEVLSFDDHVDDYFFEPYGDIFAECFLSERCRWF